MSSRDGSNLRHPGLRKRGRHTLCQNVIKHSSQILIGSSSGRRAIARRIVGRRAGGHSAQMAQWSLQGSIMLALADKEKPPINRGEDRGREVGVHALLINGPTISP
jgi:hypothetical protein